MSQTAGSRLPDPRRWKALVFISLAQLMVVLDSTVVNIALPSAQHDLGISDADRQWAITAYALAFGGLLLFGGRIADKWGRKRALVIGLIGFALASAIGGLANSEALLFGSRAFQGAFGALLAPAALSLLAVTFTDSRERAKAFGVFSAIASAGGAVGLLVGGLLTEYLNWRWTFFVNVPFAIIAALGAYCVIREPEGGRNRSPLDIPGVVLSALGLVSLVYGFTRAESSGWSAPSTIGLLVASGALLAVFAFIESKVKTPLLPLRVLTERNRGGAYASLGLAIIGMFGVFLFLTYYLQVVEGYSAIRTGLAFLPIAISFIVGATQIGTRLATRLPARMFMVPGFAVAVLGMLLLTRLEVGSSYPRVILPGLILLGLGMGTALMPVISLSTHGIQARDAGVAAAMANASQQVGGAIGTALLNTIAASATATYLAGHTSGTKLVHAQSLVHGYTHAIWWAVGIEAAAALIALTLINVGHPGSTQGASSADGTDTENVLPTGGVMPPRTFGVARPADHLMQFPAQARFDPAAGQPPDLPARTAYRSGCPRFMRMPADWWDSPPAVASPLRYAPQSASAARRLTGDTLRHWGLASLAEDAVLIVAELVANAVSHTVPSAANSEPGGEFLGLRLLRRPSEVICAVLDPSDAAPAPVRPGAVEEGGRGLQLVDALSDVWGWSPVAGRGKAVWAILFCAEPPEPARRR